MRNRILIVIGCILSSLNVFGQDFEVEEVALSSDYSGFNCSTGTIQDLTDQSIEFSPSTYNKALFLVFGSSQHVLSLFEDDKLDGVRDGLESGTEVFVTFDVNLTTSTGQNVYSDQVELEWGVPAISNSIKFVDYFKISQLSGEDFLIDIANISIQTTNCSTIPNEAFKIGLYKSFDSYEQTPSCLYNNLTISLTGTNNEFVTFSLPQGHTYSGSEIDLEWLNVERPLMDLSTEISSIDASIPSAEYSDASPSISSSSEEFSEATRVTLKVDDLIDDYKIPNLMKRGFLVARFRVVDYLPNGERVTSSWYHQSNMLKIAQTFQENVIWQSTSSYIENGQHKDVVGYYDAIQRSRQNVTQLSSENKAIVAETYYDFQGRPSVQPLPAPDLLSNSSLILRPDFNKFKIDETIVPIGPQHFDLRSYDNTINNLEKAEALSSAHGAENYYSANNTVESNVPFGNGYSYTKTLYLNDGTNRPMETSTVGETFKHEKANDHTMKYGYAIPFQIELDRLFGNNAGDARKYTKDFTIDANGQVTVVYKNMSGKVVASALRQDAPDNLDAIEGSTGVDQYQINLLKGKQSDKEYQEITDSSIAFAEAFPITDLGTIEFSYEIRNPDEADLSTPFSSKRVSLEPSPLISCFLYR